MPKGQSLYHKYPDYQITLEPNAAHTKLTFHGDVIADSERTVILRETRHAPVVYFPRGDVRFEVLEATDHETFCPFKGEARYWTLRVGEHCEENAVWGYDDPFEQVIDLVGYVAFYPDRAGLVQA